MSATEKSERLAQRANFSFHSWRGLGPLVARIRAGYEEVTPGDGVHWLYLVDSGGTKTEALARRMGVDKNGNPCALPLIETKGEGGYVVVRDTFGVATLVGTTATQAGDFAGRQFQPSAVTGDEGDNPMLVVLPSSMGTLRSDPREDVALQRDETANLRAGRPILNVRALSCAAVGE